jgi:hypothetical protein
LTVSPSPTQGHPNQLYRRGRPHDSLVVSNRDVANIDCQLSQVAVGLGDRLAHRRDRGPQAADLGSRIVDNSFAVESGDFEVPPRHFERGKVALSRVLAVTISSPVSSRSRFERSSAEKLIDSSQVEFGRHHSLLPRLARRSARPPAADHRGLPQPLLGRRNRQGIA